jgi:DNA invertase Pin-like site-specific DNA recombinase
MTNDFQKSAPRSVAYVRMPTKHQNLSIGKQMDLIRHFAKRRGLRITKVFSDRFGAGERRVP